MFTPISLPVILALASSVNAFWRMECRARTGLARIDPIVSPGGVSEHSHAIHGGSAFSATSSYDDLMNSQCTSCIAKEDKSAYWTPAMYFVHSDGTTEIVPQVGGMLAYYLLRGDNLKAFPPGFRLIAGDTRQRNFTLPIPDPPTSDWTAADLTQSALRQKALGFNCLNYAKAPEGSFYRHFLPDKSYLDANCADGIRAELMFPSCWNGQLDSSDHKSHMAYPSLVTDGTCPQGYSQRTVSLMYETIWNTAQFKGVDGKFVFANGDPTGFGYHGDFMTGWDPAILQQAMNQCRTNDAGGHDISDGVIEECKVFTMQSLDDMDKCNFKMPSKLATEDCTGPMAALPGDVQIQPGPGYAVPGSSSGGYAAAPPAPAAPSQAAPSAAPTLSYKPATSDPVAPVAPSNYNTPPPAKASSAAPSSASQDVAVANVAPPSQITPAPTAPPAALQSGYSVVSTSYSTSNGQVYEIVLIETESVVTETVTTYAKKNKRHAHHHRRRAHNFGYDF